MDRDEVEAFLAVAVYCIFLIGAVAYLVWR